MAGAISFENQLGDLIEWLFLGVEIPIIVIIIAALVFLVLFYFAARRGVPKTLQIPGKDVYIELQGGNVTINVGEAGEEVVEEAVVEEVTAEDKGPEINDLRLVADINSAVLIIAKKHELDSLTLANTEGLVIASASDASEEEAAEAASVVTSSPPVGENPVETETGGLVVQLAHKENAILVHMRGQRASEDLEAILQDVKVSLEHTLA